MSPTIQSIEEQEALKEHEKLQLLQVYQKLFVFLIYKKRWLYLFLFLLMLVLGITVRHFQYQVKHDKFSGEITMFYAPCDRTPVRTLNLPQLLVIFSRSNIMQQLSDELALSPEDRGRLNDDLKIQLLRDQKNMFKIQGTGPSRIYVQNLLNTFSDICIRNYREHRLQQLNTYLNERRSFSQELENRQGYFHDQKNRICTQYGIQNPEMELTHLKNLGSEYKIKLTEMKIHLNEMETKFRISEKQYKTIPRNVILNAQTIRKYLEEIHTRKKELDQIRLVFIDRNPRTIECRTSYENIIREFEQFKNKYQITEFREDMLYGLEQLVAEHMQISARLDLARSNLKIQEEKLEKCSARQRMLQQIAPEYSMLDNSLRMLNSNLADIQEEILKARGAVSRVNGELTLNERLHTARSSSRFNAKILILILGGSVMITCIIITLVTLTDMIFGNVCSFDELLIYNDLIPMLGVIPRESLRHQEEASILLSTLYYNVMTYLKNSRTIFTCPVDGVQNASQTFCKKLIQIPRHSVSLCLMRTGKLDCLRGKIKQYHGFYYSNQDLTELDWSHMITAEEITEPTINMSETTADVPPDQNYELGDGNIWVYFPILNINAMSPEETILLRQAIKDLSGYYKEVIIRRLKDFRTPCMLIKQLIDICDSTVLIVGKHQTPRKVFRKILTLLPKEHSIYSVLTNSSQLKRIAKGEYF